MNKTTGTSGAQKSQPDAVSNTMRLSSENQGRGGKKMLTLTHNHSQAQAMVVPNKPWYFNPKNQVQVGHTCNVQPVAVMIILGKIFARILSALGVKSKSHVPHICAEHQ